MSTNPNKRKREDEEDQPKTPIGKKLLENFSVADVMPYRKETLITIDPTVSFASALKQLIEHKILAAPLVDKKTGNCSGNFLFKNEFLGNSFCLRKKINHLIGKSIALHFKFYIQSIDLLKLFFPISSFIFIILIIHFVFLLFEKVLLIWLIWCVQLSML